MSIPTTRIATAAGYMTLTVCQKSFPAGEFTLRKKSPTQWPQKSAVRLITLRL